MLPRSPGLLLLQALALAANAESDADRPPWEVSAASACEGKEVRYNECHQGPCSSCTPVDCEVRPWSDWSAGECTGLCMRQRGISQPANGCGTPCTNSLIETKRCPQRCEKPPVCPKGTDCVWADWTDWSGCTCNCGGGQKTRDRHIKVSPEGSGKECEARTKSEIVPCNTQPCGSKACVDGAWGDWGRWGDCSASCGGGLRWRRRSVAREATDCGKPAVGNDRQIEACSTDACSGDEPCRFGRWSDWSDCSCSCDGVQRRSRRIDAYGKGNGKPCQGATEEVAPCHRASETPGCSMATAPVDCEFATWLDWQDCSATCGPGQQRRSRRVVLEAKNGGRPCVGALEEQGRCQVMPCPLSDGRRPPKPCVWGVWQDWGSCDKCGGQRKRFRLILQMAEDGGSPCKMEASEETGECPRQCDKVYCSWGPWQEGTCSVSCGVGTVQRTRYLKTLSELPVDISMYEELPLAAGRVDAEGHFHTLLLGVATGCGLTVLGQRAWSGRGLAGDAPGADRASADEELPLRLLQPQGRQGWLRVNTAGSDSD